MCNSTLSRGNTGSSELGCATVNASQGHEKYKTWLALFNPEKGLEPQGFLKVSVSAVKAGQQHADHAGEEDDDDDGMVVLPPEMNIKPHNLCFSVYKAKDIPKMDVWGSSDGFISIDFCGATMRTETEKDTLTPVWMTELRMPVGVPTMSDAIRLELFDEDWGVGDDFIGLMFDTIPTIIKNSI